jgi:hypothetical protein
MNPSESVTKPPEVAVQNRTELSGIAKPVESGPEVAPVGEVHQGGPANDPVFSAPTNTQLPPIANTPAVSQQVAASTDDTPLVAADDEVIEQEWVQKAKNIVSQTKGDPFNQEKAVGKLQAEYIKKRYGKEIKLTSD